MTFRTAVALSRAFSLFWLHASLANAQSRTDAAPQSLDDWKVENAAPNGSVFLSGRNHKGYYRAYVCPRFDQAAAVVAAIPALNKDRTSVQRQRAAMAASLRKNDCVPAKGQYQVTLVGREIEIDRGTEAQEYWTALMAMNASGRTIGLVFDSSPFAITD